MQSGNNRQHALTRGAKFATSCSCSRARVCGRILCNFDTPVGRAVVHSVWVQTNPCAHTNACYRSQSRSFDLGM